jgi:hypothetical protein
MKFLWIFTTAIATYFAYHTYTNTRIRYKDLESVMQQNLVVEKGYTLTQENITKEITFFTELTEKRGNFPENLLIIKKSNNIKEYIDSIINSIDSLVFTTKDKKNNLKPKNIAQLSNYRTNLSKFIVGYDTSLRELGQEFPLCLDTLTHPLPFIQKNTIGIKSRIANLSSKCVDRVISKISVGCGFDKIIAMAVPKSKIARMGKNYEAMMFIDATIFNDRRLISLRPKIQVSEGKVDMQNNIIGNIEIKNVKAQNYNSEGKATKTLTGKITIKKADGNDTTFTLSTSYTIKKK